MFRGLTPTLAREARGAGSGLGDRVVGRWCLPVAPPATSSPRSHHAHPSTPPILQVPGNAVMFFVYEMVKQRLAAAQGLASTADLGQGSLVIAGGLAGTAFWVPVFPADVVKSKWQVDTPVHGQYRGVLDCAAQVRWGGRLEGWAWPRRATRWRAPLRPLPPTSDPHTSTPTFPPRVHFRPYAARACAGCTVGSARVWRVRSLPTPRASPPMRLRPRPCSDLVGVGAGRGWASLFPFVGHCDKPQRERRPGLHTGQRPTSLPQPQPWRSRRAAAAVAPWA